LKKQFATPQQPEVYIFFLDRNLGSKQLAEATVTPLSPLESAFTKDAGWRTPFFPEWNCIAQKIDGGRIGSTAPGGARPVG
jgi:hypothetical protein